MREVIVHTEEHDHDAFARVSHERDMFKRQFIKIQENYENKIRELSVLKELGNLLRSEIVYEQSALWREQIRIIKQYTFVESIAILFLENDNKTLTLKAAIGNPHDYSILLETITLHNLQQQVIVEKTPVIIDTCEMDSIITDGGNPFSGSLLYLPITHNGKTIGVLGLLHNKEHWFDRNKMRFLDMVADEIATSLVMFRLYHKMLKEEKQRTLLSRFFSESVTEKIYGSEGSLQLGGERKKATIFFADLCGFTAMSEELDEETVVEILNAYFSVMTPIIFKHNGTLDKLMGDGMLALFGAPISHEDDALQAVQAAVEMIMALAEFNRNNSGRGWPLLSVSIGINTGDVVAGYIGSEEHLNYTAIGDAVNVAQRIQTLAGGNEILISKTVCDETVDRIAAIKEIKALEPIQAQKVKGKEKTIDLFRIDMDHYGTQ